MSELEQLKSDLKVFERAMASLADSEYLALGGLAKLIDITQAKLRKLEEPPDPFRYAKEVVKTIRASSVVRDEIGSYCVSLEDEVACLKEQLENRPVVWCLKNYQGELYTHGPNNLPRLFDSMLDADGYAKRHGYYWLKADIYTGKESE